MAGLKSPIGNPPDTCWTPVNMVNNKQARSKAVLWKTRKVGKNGSYSRVVPGWARREERLSRSELYQPFRIDSDAVLHMNLIHWIRFGSCEVWRLNRALLCFQLTRDVRFNWNMCNFKFSYLSRGQLVSLNLDKILLPLLKILPCYEAFLVTWFLPLLLECCAEIILKATIVHYKTHSKKL